MVAIVRDIFSEAFHQGTLTSTLIKLVFWKCNQFFLKFPMIVKLKDDIQCICYPDSSYSSLVVYLNYPEPKLFESLRVILKPHHIFIDIGANIGLVSLVASTITKKRIYAFEADQRVFPRLKENIRLNEKNKQIKPYFMAVSDRIGFVSFTEESHAEVSHVSYQTGAAQQKKNKVPTTSMDAFFKENDLNKKCVVKIDVEGAELTVLKGMKKALRSRQIDAILLEINQNCRHFNHEPEATVAWLHRVGYQVFRLEDNELLVPKSKIEFHNETAINVLVLPKEL